MIIIDKSVVLIISITNKLKSLCSLEVSSNTGQAPSLPSAGTIGSCSYIISQGRRLGKTIWCNCGVLGSILLLHPSACYVTSNPRSYILVGLNHDEEDDAVDDNHAKNHTEINPF